MDERQSRSAKSGEHAAWHVTIIISKVKIREQEVGADILWEGPGLMPHIVSETLTGTGRRRGEEVNKTRVKGH